MTPATQEDWELDSAAKLADALVALRGYIHAFGGGELAGWNLKGGTRVVFDALGEALDGASECLFKAGDCNQEGDTRDHAEAALDHLKVVTDLLEGEAPERIGGQHPRSESREGRSEIVGGLYGIRWIAGLVSGRIREGLRELEEGGSA